MGNTTETFQIPPEAAEAYETAFVPRLFGEWARLLVDSVDLEKGHRVLDVACGTGIVARVAVEKTGDQGKVVGLDVNQAMLDVARRLGPKIEWRQGDAANLPFSDNSFDFVFCQAALMFFPEPAAALREMGKGGRSERHRRHPGLGSHRRPTRLSPLHRGGGSPCRGRSGFHPQRLFPPRGPRRPRCPVRSGGPPISDLRTETTIMRFASVEEFVDVEVRSTPWENASPRTLSPRLSMKPGPKLSVPL